MDKASLVISCPDKVGIVRAVTDFLFRHGANITYLEQHIEDEQFFMRIEWQVLDYDVSDESTFMQIFESVRQEFDMEIKTDFCVEKKRLALFCSKELHCIVDVLGRIETRELEVEVPCIISNYRDAHSIAEKFSVPFYYLPAKNDYEYQQLALMREHRVDLIGLARYMKILSSEFISDIGSNRIINVHHSFLPSFVGANPYEEAYQRGVKLIGATAHFVIPELDQGPIIEQNVKRISHSYDVPNLKLLGREIEREVFFFAIRKFCENKLVKYRNRVIVFE
ncbi:formyltetrahydrofolate deformylase [Candidatus Peregrinibacteria bacterium]|nr:formyltetrahydrofolate deformylase [Candidatus Peregrinibacteria bacterium]